MLFVVPWIVYWREWNKNAEEHIDGDVTDEGIRREWETNYLFPTPSLPVDLSDDEKEKCSGLVLSIRAKCQYAEGILEGIDGSDTDHDIREKQTVDKFIQTCLSDADKINDSFFRSMALHPISDLLSKAGQYERARELIAQIPVDFIRDKATEVLVEQESRRSQ